MASRAPPVTDPAGRYFVGADISWITVGVYLFLLLVVVLFLPTSSVLVYPWVAWVIAAFVVLLLVRYLSTCYWMDSERLTGFRLLGGRRIRLETIRRIQYASLRDLSPTGFFGSWGYRGRMWSPGIGTFDSVQTTTAGVLVFAEPYPVFITPKHREDFVRELSRRVRSWRGPLEVDHGAPEGEPAAAD